MGKQKNTKLPVSRIYAISDSLKKKAQFQAGGMDFAAQRLKSAKTPQEKKDATSIIEGLSRSSEHNYQKSDRLKSVADKAMATAKIKATAGRDTPLPSSDGIIGTIKSWFE